MEIGTTKNQLWKEERENGAYGSRYHGGHRLDKDDKIRRGRWMTTLDRTCSDYGFYSSSRSYT